MKRALFFAAASFLLAQDATFNVDTKLVVINVTVKDKAGRPIADLKKEDFQLLEDGVPQKVTVFDRQDLSSEPLPPVSFSQRPPTIEERAAALAPGSVVNQQVQGDPKRFENRRLIGLYFDMSSMEPTEQARAQEGAVKWIQSQMTGADLVGVMTFGSKFRMVQEFTDD
ncbi:MAG: VWA domain-containing protein, partial [Acidobacteriota bacterium]|nr:VWA domain-containing protein [Acidobacteriota bacterium]